jgi:hypothetical protein
MNPPSHRRTLSGSQPSYPSKLLSTTTAVINPPNTKNTPYMKTRQATGSIVYNIPYKLEEKNFIQKNIDNVKGHRKSDSFNNISFLNKSRDNTPNTSRPKPKLGVNFKATSNVITSIPINFVKKDSKPITTGRNNPTYRDRLNKSNNSKLNDSLNNSFLSSNSFMKPKNNLKDNRSFNLDRSISRPKTPNTVIQKSPGPNRPKTSLGGGMLSKNNCPAIYSSYLRKLNFNQSNLSKNSLSNKIQTFTHNTNEVSTNSTFRSKVDVNSNNTKLKKEEEPGIIYKNIPIKYDSKKSNFY